jgi:hypothetical protein
MQIRLMGLPAEVAAAEKALLAAAGLRAVSTSEPQPNRGRSSEVRVYLRVLLSDDPPAD